MKVNCYKIKYNVIDTPKFSLYICYIEFSYNHIFIEKSQISLEKGQIFLEKSQTFFKKVQMYKKEQLQCKQIMLKERKVFEQLKMTKKQNKKKHDWN